MQSAPTATPSGGGSGTTAWQTSYSYDAVGNRLSMTANGQETAYTYNALDQLLNATSSAQTAQYAYDGRGNLNTVTNGATTAYNFDVHNRLAQVTNGSQTASFAYDAMGQHIQQVANGTTTNYLWDPLSPYGDVVLAAATGSMNAQSSYVMDGSELLTQNLTQAGTTTQSYYLQDGQGSVRTLTNTSGVPTDHYAYDAFGNAYAPGTSGTTSNPYRYAGQQFDSATGLYDMRARYYDPTQGRFLGQDTNSVALSNPVELNRYAYTANNPINGFDPSGRDIAESGMIYQPIIPGSSAVAQLSTNALIGAVAGGLGYGAGLVIAGVIRFIKECAQSSSFNDCINNNDAWTRVYTHFNPGDLILNILFGGFMGIIYTAIPAVSETPLKFKDILWPTSYDAFLNPATFMNLSGAMMNSLASPFVSLFKELGLNLGSPVFVYAAENIAAQGLGSITNHQEIDWKQVGIDAGLSAINATLRCVGFNIKGLMNIAVSSALNALINVDEDILLGGVTS